MKNVSRERESALPQRARGLGPVDALAVADEDVLGRRSRASCRGGVGFRRPWTPMRSPPTVKNGFVPSASATTSTRGSGHQSATSCQCLRAPDLDHLERRPRQRPRHDEMRDAEPLRERGAVTVVPVEELEHACGAPSDCAARSIASGQSTGSTSQTPPSCARACDVRVIGSSTIHENPCGPRSSQKRICHALDDDGSAPIVGVRSSVMLRRHAVRPAAADLLVVVLSLIQFIPYGRDHTNPQTVQELKWSTPQTRALAQEACFDCHSNLTEWPWYTTSRRSRG